MNTNSLRAPQEGEALAPTWWRYVEEMERVARMLDVRAREGDPCAVETARHLRGIAAEIRRDNGAWIVSHGVV